MECWSGGVLECWSVGVLECWSVGVMENCVVDTFHVPVNFGGRFSKNAVAPSRKSLLYPSSRM